MIQRLRKSLNWKYALGEVVLIFIGITLAMWFNNWNENRRDRALEQQYLLDLRQDLVNDTVTISVVLGAIEGHIVSAENILNFMDNDEISDTIELIGHFRNAGFLYFFNPDLSTYNDLVNSGNLRVIRDSELKDKMSEYVSRLKQIESRYELNKKMVWEDYGLHMSKHVDGRLRAAWNDDIPSALEKYPIDWKRLRQDDELKRRTTMVISGGTAETRWHVGLKRFIKELIEYLDLIIK